MIHKTNPEWAIRIQWKKYADRTQKNQQPNQMKTTAKLGKTTAKLNKIEIQIQQGSQ